jgi:hypothetical protein
MSKRPDAFAHLSSMLESQRETTDAAPALPAEIVPGTDAELSTSEQQALSHYEQVIERGLKTFFEVGAALLHVRDLRLYRTEYATFEAYCDEKWGMGKAYAHRLIGAATVRDNLSPIGDVLPANEAQARPLTLLEPEQQREAWQTALERANETGKKLTAALVEAVVREMQPTPAAQEEEGGSVMSPDIPPAAAPTIIDIQPEEADDDDDAEPVMDGQQWPDDLAELRHQLAEHGYVLLSETESRLVYQNYTTDDVIRIVKPPEPGQVKVRVVANASDDWRDIEMRLSLVGVRLDNPRAGHLPKYPETQRAYGELDMSREHGDVQSQLYTALAMSRSENERLGAMPDRLLSLLNEYQEHITRAQKYKATSDRGEAVSPLLRLIEQIYYTVVE